MGEAPGRWRTVEHTADLAIEVEAPSLEGLFEAAGHGLTGVLLGSEAGRVQAAGAAAVRRELALEAPDREALLVEWLRELLFVQVSEGLLFAGAEIEELGDTRLVARAAFRPPTNVAAVARELKGVTYHDLEVSRRGDGWFGRIVFDL
jgi:SHS2 domain-containing protein